MVLGRKKGRSEAEKKEEGEAKLVEKSLVKSLGKRDTEQLVSVRKKIAELKTTLADLTKDLQEAEHEANEKRALAAAKESAAELKAQATSNLAKHGMEFGQNGASWAKEVGEGFAMEDSETVYAASRPTKGGHAETHGGEDWLRPGARETQPSAGVSMARLQMEGAKEERRDVGEEGEPPAGAGGAKSVPQKSFGGLRQEDRPPPAYNRGRWGQ